MQNFGMKSWLILGLMLAVALGVGAYFQAKQAKSPGGITASHSVGGETRAVRMPDRFSSLRAQLSYIAALKYPGLLDKIHCYCNCDRPPFNHKSLLSCFTDYHALN